MLYESVRRVVLQLNHDLELYKKKTKKNEVTQFKQLSSVYGKAD